MTLSHQSTSTLTKLRLQILTCLLLVLSAFSLMTGYNFIASPASAHDFTQDEYCLRNVYANNDQRNNATGIKCNSENVWTLSTADTDLYCIRQKSSGNYLSDDPSLWSRCSTGEKWKIIVKAGKSGLICLQNNYTGKYLYVGSGGFKYADRCSIGEYWRFQKVPTLKRSEGFRLHSEPHMVAFFDRPEATDESGLPEQDRKNCGPGWREVTEAKGFMVRGTTNPSEVGLRLGEPMSDDTAPTHFHDVLFEMYFPGREVAGAGGPNTTPTAARVWRRGVATTKATADGTPYRQMLICEEVEPKAAKNVPVDTVAFFNGQSCPEGWTTYGPLNGRFALPKPKDMTSGFDPNSRIAGDSATLFKGHAHMSGNSASIDVGDFSLVLAKWFFSSNHNYGGIEGKRGTAMLLDSIRADGSGYSTIQHPFITYLACKKTNRSADIEALKRTAAKMTIFTTAANCPNALDTDSATWGRFLVGLPGEPQAKSGSTFGGNTSLEGLTSRELPTHKHEATVPVYLNPRGIAGGNGCCRDGFATSGTAKGQVVSSAVEASIAYAQLSFCSVPKKGAKPRK